jgi:P-type Ca2+ transporter type 2C
MLIVAFLIRCELSGLPLAITLALAFATKRMTYEKLLVRVLGSCETMANASVVCTDKTGTLTQNVMTVVAGSVGIHGKFVRNLKDNQTRTNADEKQGVGTDVDELEDVDEKLSGKERKFPNDFSLDQGDLNSIMSVQLRALFNSAIAVNSTAFAEINPESGKLVFVGSKTETALLQFAEELGWPNYKHTRHAVQIIQMYPFSSERKAMAVVVQTGSSRWRLYVKGASEILTKKCTRHVLVSRDHGQDGGEVETADIDELGKENISRTIIFYANQTLRTIAVCYRDFDSWPPTELQSVPVNEVCYYHLAQS